MIVPTLREMGSLVSAMLQECEMAIYNQAVAKQAQLQQLEAKEQTQQPAAVAASQEPEEEAAPDVHVVEDLVEDIKEKPQ